MNQDRGIAPERKKGAAVHLAAMRKAFRALGATVGEFDEALPDRLRERLEQAHARERFDLVYERYSLGGTVGTQFAAHHGLPCVLEVNAPLADEDKRYRSREASVDLLSRERLIFSAATRVIAVSTEVARYARELGASPEAVFVLPNGVDLELFRPRASDDPLRKTMVPAGRVALGFHGRLRPWHGFPRLVEACVELCARGSPIHLVLVGEGDFAAAIAGKIAADRVSLVGWVAHEEVGRYVACFDLLPLSYDPEAPCYFSPLKLAEAMACGVVPIVPRLGDLDQLVQDGHNGLVVPPGNVQALTRAIDELARDAERRRTLAQAAIASVQQRTWSAIAQFVLANLPSSARP